MVKIGFLEANAQLEVLVDLIKSLGVYALGEVGVLLGPVLEDCPETRTYATGLLHQILTLLVEEELQTVCNQHQIEDQVFVLGLVTRNADHIPHQLRILCDETVADVPTGLSDHVRKKNPLDFIHEEDLGDRLEYLIYRELEGDGAAAGHRPEYGDN